jgi:hypothetical protein
MLTKREILMAFGLLSLTMLLSGCISQFLPETTESQKILVVEGLITDQPGPKTIKLSVSMPLGERSVDRPLSGCVVNVTDDDGVTKQFTETAIGVYSSVEPYQGEVGRSYKLHIKTGADFDNKEYESKFVMMNPVPPVDSLYYKKVVIEKSSDGLPMKEGAQLYLSTHDPQNLCHFYRWEFTETWQFSLPYYVDNKTCWTTENSKKINIKSTLNMGDDRIVRFPIQYLDNNTDKLSMRYSILVNQLSLSEEEYEYWDKLQNTVQDVGSLYDMIPSSVSGNMVCLQNPSEKVLGYFSVSASRTKRLFIKAYFAGGPKLYTDCANSYVRLDEEVYGLNVTIWLLYIIYDPPPGIKVMTFLRYCADCTTRGTTAMPDFWNDDITNY